MQHTKGIWEHFIQPSMDGLCRTVNVGSKRIATLEHVGIEESEANVQLICAAPDLYKALYELLQCYINTVPKSKQATELLVNSANAINKATGIIITEKAA